MSTATVSNTVTCLGKTFSATRVPSADGAVVKDPPMAAAKTGTLTTRTDNNTGTFTMAAGHGLATSDRVDVYWTGGSRYGMTATVTVNSAVLDGGGGDNLPIATTEVTVMKPQLESFSVAAADLIGLFVGSTVPAQAVFIADDDSVVKAVYVDGATDSFQWDSGSDATTPFGDDVVSVYLSHGSSAGSKQVSALALSN